MITAEMLLENKKVIEEGTAEKEDVITLSRLEKVLGDGEIKIKSLSVNKIQNITKMNAKDEYKITLTIVQNAVTNIPLKDKEFQKQLGCKINSTDIVEKIFLPREVKAISEKVAILSGISADKNEEIIKKIKNSSSKETKISE
ncbi:phage XkdN-like protein [Clostridium saccharobutylicum]|uniref:Phage XkdN-like protein n=1 Tax=Clostridium saccharobutylicum DSM 13864 TaxID=1345695 RepID=U5MRP3_CLOSA|nr:phage XkdN-like protein [Clostridium saccharobutylicum]AGX43280.1 phage XkdN-like protein [Clostridium saccharobutylicum DSM 13864]AQR90580.1 phage XkdN-like protein [Clostridium saccharobutylicum]AQS00484.1 phage XkdN-like protein [Clostridium saccharobutylicum]AQS10134.1 phage XkdN-like protein [Clostridium saccharobutylicum]AQS14467.1 phage XkdN-like protein [Clostridium saccharobutylicum]